MHTARTDWGSCARRSGGEAGRAAGRFSEGSRQKADGRRHLGRLAAHCLLPTAFCRLLMTPPWTAARPTLDPIGAFPMTWCRVLVVPLALAGLASPAPAAGPGIFAHKPKYNPAERVPELLIQL